MSLDKIATYTKKEKQSLTYNTLYVKHKHATPRLKPITYYRFLDIALEADIGRMDFRFCNSSNQQLPVNLL